MAILCKGDCKQCNEWGFIFPKKQIGNNIVFCLECKKYGVLGTSFSELFSDVINEFYDI